MELIYEPVLLAAVGSRVFLEVHRDAYQLAATTLERVRELALSQGLSDRVDWEAARRVVQLRHGLARDVTVAAAPVLLPGDEGR